MVEWIHNLELMLHNSPVKAEHHFEGNRVAGEQIQATARAIKVRTTISELDEGFISQEAAPDNLVIRNLFLRVQIFLDWQLSRNTKQLTRKLNWNIQLWTMVMMVSSNQQNEMYPAAETKGTSLSKVSLGSNVRNVGLIIFFL